MRTYESARVEVALCICKLQIYCTDLLVFLEGGFMSFASNKGVTLRKKGTPN